MGDLKSDESSDYHRMYLENRDLRVRVMEQAKELNELRQFRFTVREWWERVDAEEKFKDKRRKAWDRDRKS